MVLSLVEQIFASGFTFFIFICATRLLADSELEMYTALFSLNQSFAFFLFGLVLLPMSSAAGEEAGKQLGISLVLMAGLLLAFAGIAPVVMDVFAGFKGTVDARTWGLVVAFFAAQCGYESARWLSIRLRGGPPALIVTLLRFALFFGVILGLGASRLDATRFALIQIGVNTLSVLGYGLLVGRRVGEVRLALPDRAALKHLATFGNSVASFLTNFTVVALVDRGLGSGGLAAFQAIRSATNPIGLISQVLDNHFSADLARTGRRPERKAKGMTIALILAALLMALGTLFAPKINALLFDGKFDEYGLLIPLLLLASLAHALTRPIFVGWRIGNDSAALNLYSLALIVVVLPLLLLSGLMSLSYTMIALFACVPVAALVIDLIRRPVVPEGEKI